MKKQLSKLRRFFARTGARKLDATATREAIPVSYDDDDGSTRLSGAFIIVLLLHVVALVGVFTYSRMRENNTTASDANAAAIAAATRVAKSPAPDIAQKAPLAVQQAPAPTETPRNTESDLPPIPAAPAPVRIGRTHVVKSGETLTRIALAYSISKTDLASANGIRNENELRAGQELAIPSAKSTKSETKSQMPPKPFTGSYTVRKGETLAKIANSLDVKYEDLIKANGIKDPKKLREGQKLKVPGK